MQKVIQVLLKVILESGVATCWCEIEVNEHEHEHQRVRSNVQRRHERIREVVKVLFSLTC